MNRRRLTSFFIAAIGARVRLRLFDSVSSANEFEEEPRGVFDMIDLQDIARTHRVHPVKIPA